ncbi:facilitated trehalose transporter Tret1-2 homolog [Drosophila gunungcola]|uniref:facilitated trehalose transporter Tret1-2 homolog n=1 Tax=Drosophila gunungcola TaxID=103775 RepID=UPI0022E1E02C|nr:facilitated trehalose transporter Tret1-2 homolog [Drosophila gunungcola]
MSAAKQFIVGIIAAMGALCLGTVIGWSGPVEEEIKSGQAFDFVPDTTEWGLVGSLMTLGAACSCIPVGVLIGKIGRKVTMLCLLPPFVIGWALIILAAHIAMLLVGRFIVGFCGGAFCVASPMYTTEVAEVKYRGIMGCFFQLLIVHGILYSFVVGAFVNTLCLGIACTIWPIIYFLLFMWMPESPVYLAQKGKTERAEKALKFLRGKDADVGGELKDMAAEGQKEQASIGKTLCRKVTLKGLFLSITLMIFQQFTGINAIVFYTTFIFMSAGSSLEPRFSTIVVGIVMAVSTVISIFLIERLGRKILLLISALMMGISTLIMSLYFGLLLDSDVGWLALMAICIFIIGFSVGFGPVPWVMMAELFAEDVKAIAGSIAGTTNWLAAFVVTLLFPVLNEQIGATACFGIFFGFAVAAFLFVLFLIPETKGRTINEIQAKLGEKKE